MSKKRQKQLEEDQLLNNMDKKVHHKLQIERVHDKQGIWSLKQSANGKFVIYVQYDSIKIRSSATLKLLMKRHYHFRIIDACVTPNFKLFVITINNGNLFIYQNFFNLVYHKKFEQQQKVKFINNEELLIWSSQYLMKFNVSNQQIAYEMNLNKDFPICYLDFNLQLQLIFIGSNNVKIRTLNDGLLVLESDQQKDDQIEYIRYQENNQIITRHKLNIIIIWKFYIDQSIIQQCQVINPLDNLEIIYTSMLRQDYIFTIQRRNKMNENLFFIIIYTKTGSIINIVKQMSDYGFMIIKIVGQHSNYQLHENKCIFLQTLSYFLFYFQTPFTNLGLRYEYSHGDGKYLKMMQFYFITNNYILFYLQNEVQAIQLQINLEYSKLLL